MRSAIKISFLFLFILGVQALQSCRHEPTLPDKEVSFSSDIIPIIGDGCQTVGCHGSSGGDFALVTYSDMLEDDRIVPFEPYKSKIYKTITSQSKTKVMPVPPQKPLTETEIQTIYIWIKQGALNN